jgi:branched-chain amino acid transport system ATP-binding protein
MLTVENLNAYYGDSHILQGISFRLKKGRCMALLGRNGAGKTTTLRSILGYVPRTSGRILLDDCDVRGLPTSRIVRRGLSYVPENRGIFPSLTVDEHLHMAEAVASRGQRWTIDDVYALFPRLAERRFSSGGKLSGGEQQMLAIGRALVGSSRFVVLDEPSEGLAPVVVELIRDALLALKAQGTTLLLVEQNYALALSLLDDVCVLAQGRVVFSGEKADLEAAPDLIGNYLSV